MLANHLPDPYAFVPARAALMHLMPPIEWAILELVCGLAVFILTFIQKRFDNTYASYDFFGHFSYITMVLKAGFAVYVMLDAIHVGATQDYPRPLATIAMGLMAMTQIRTLAFQLNLRRVVQRAPKLPLFGSSSGLLVAVDALHFSPASSTSVKDKRRTNEFRHR